MDNEQNNQSYRILEDLIEGCQVIDFEWKYVFINNAAALHNQRPKEELLGKRYMDMWPGIEETEVFRLIENCLKERKSHHFENKFTFPNGILSGWFELSIQPVPEGVFILSIDITKQKELEQNLKESERRWKFAIEGSGDGLWDWNADTDEVFYSETLKNMLGYSGDEFENKLEEWEKRVHPDDKDEVFRDLNNHYNKKTSHYENEHRLLCKNGNYIWIHDRGKVLKWDADGKPLRMIGTHRNIDSRKKAEVELKQEKQRFEKFAATLPGMLFSFHLSPNGKYSMPFASSASIDVYGFTPKEITENFNIAFERFHPDDIDEVNRRIEESAKLMKPWKYSYRYNHPKKGEIWLEGHSVPVREDDGSIIWHGYITDITEQKLAEEKISYHQMLIDQMGKVAKIGGWEFDPETGKGTWTEQVALIHEMDPDDETSLQQGISFYSEDSKAKIEAAINEAITKGTPYDLELELITPSGKHKWVQTIGQAIYKDGKVVNVRGSFQDITTRKHDENKLRESEEKFRSIFEQSASGMAITGIDGKLIQYNQVFCEIVGYTKNELKNIHFSSITHPDDIEIGNEVIKKLIDGKVKKTSMEKRYVKKSGEPVWVHINSVLLRDNNNEPEFFLSQIEDISDRIEAENQLKISENRYKALVEQSLTGIYIFDVHNYIYVNQRFCEIFGYTENEILTKLKPNDIISEKDRNYVNENARLRLKGEIESAGFTVKGNHKTGKPLWIELYGMHVFLDGKDVIIGTVVDITDKKLAEDEIKKLNENLEKKVMERTAQLESKNNELETFTYSVSHDLKAPLRGIDGYSRLLEELYADKMEGEAKWFLEAIQEGTRQMNQLIEDLLAYSRLERAMIRYTTFNVKDFVQRILSLYSHQIEFQKVKIETDLPDFEIHTDIDSLAVALRNIVENAVKFSKETDEPKVRISCMVNDDSCILVVKDNGIGFDMKYKDRIFEIFQRLNLAESFSGTGIGLAMVKKSMERINGNVRAESTPGEGATFYLEIPKINDNEND